MKRQVFFSSKKLMFASLAALTVVAMGVIGGKTAASTIQDCTTNSIIKCGVQSPTEFINKVKANNPPDLQAIYAASNLPASDYAKFAANARPGMALRDGRIVVDGQTVATNASSLGREKFSYSVPLNIAGKTYYASNNRDVLNQDLPVMVLFNSQGVMQVAVMNACANPTRGAVVTPRYSCDMLQKTAVAGKPNTYNFSTKATATNNAKITKVVYNFGDGTTDTQTNPATVIQHTYTKPGTYTAQVTVYATLPGNQTVTFTSYNCKTQIVVPTPVQECVSLTAFGVHVTRREYRFTVTTKQSGGSTFKNASFNFGDQTAVVTVDPASATTAVTTHTFAKGGTYTVTATVNFNTISGVKSATCTARVIAQPDVCPLDSTLPKDSPNCKPCPHNPELPVGSPLCVAPPVTPPTTPAAPTELFKAGPASMAGMVGLFGATSVLGMIGHRLFLSRKLSRR